MGPSKSKNSRRRKFSELDSECDSTPEPLREEAASTGPAGGPAFDFDQKKGDLDDARSGEGRRTRARTRADAESSKKSTNILPPRKPIGRALPDEPPVRIKSAYATSNRIGVRSTGLGDPQRPSEGRQPTRVGPAPSDSPAGEPRRLPTGVGITARIGRYDSSATVHDPRRVHMFSASGGRLHDPPLRVNEAHPDGGRPVRVGPAADAPVRVELPIQMTAGAGGTLPTRVQPFRVTPERVAALQAGQPVRAGPVADAPVRVELPARLAASGDGTLPTVVQPLRITPERVAAFLPPLSHAPIEEALLGLPDFTSAPPPGGPASHRPSPPHQAGNNPTPTLLPTRVEPLRLVSTDHSVLTGATSSKPVRVTLAETERGRRTTSGEGRARLQPAGSVVSGAETIREDAKFAVERRVFLGQDQRAWEQAAVYARELESALGVFDGLSWVDYNEALLNTADGLPDTYKLFSPEADK